MQVFGRRVMTPFAGRVSLQSLSVVVLAIQPVALMVLLLVPELAGVIASTVLFGAAKGCLTLVRPAFVADLSGPAHYAGIASVLAFTVTLAQAAAPLGAGAAYDAIGRYDPILLATPAGRRKSHLHHIRPRRRGFSDLSRRVLRNTQSPESEHARVSPRASKWQIGLLSIP
jgi:hypothetical protein